MDHSRPGPPGQPNLHHPHIYRCVRSALWTVDPEPAFGNPSAMTAESISFPLPAGDDPLLTKKDLADRWQCSVSFIEKRPPADLPPRCCVIPGQARYRLSDILRFEASRIDTAHPQVCGTPPQTRIGPKTLERPTTGFPIRLPITAPAHGPRRGRRPIPAIQDAEPA